MEMEKAPFEDEELSFLSEKGALPVGSMSQPASHPGSTSLFQRRRPARASCHPPPSHLCYYSTGLTGWDYTPARR